jgi:RND family efflux transporter MFP subunit
LAKAEEVLEGATITAPMDGIVTAVTGAAGDTVTVVNKNTTDVVNTGTFITVEDLTHPQVQVSIDESDLANFAVGCAADVSFDSLSNQKYVATVTQVSPTLVSVSSVSMVQGLVDLEKKQTAAGKSFPLGLTASVDVTCSQAKDVLLAPAQALYQTTGQTYVYVLNAQGNPEKRTVEIGLKTVALMEIRSGLKAGELVITSQVQGS